MAGKIKLHILLLCFLASTGSVWMKKTSKACASEQTDYGYVCVCNSTYCDTIAEPTKLKSGKYYHYSTSETSPGFNRVKGSFHKSEDLSLGNSSSDVTVTIDTTTTYQTFSGVGGGLSDSSAYIYSLLPTAAQKNLIESFFGSTGIELTFGRVPLGDTDFSLNYYSYDDTVDDINMTNFALTTFETETKIPFIQAALSATSRTLNLVATPWTSPSWMKDNNDTLPGMLIPSYQEAFSNYIIKFIEAYEEQGMEFWALCPMNEVIFAVDANFQMPNVIMLPVQLRALVRDYLGPMMAEAGYEDVKILVMDDERPFLPWYAETLLSDNETAQYIDGFALHWYSDSDDTTDLLDDFHTQYPDQLILYTEASGNDQTSGGGRGGGGFTGGMPTGGGGGMPTGGGGGGGGGGGPTGAMPTGGSGGNSGAMSTGGSGGHSGAMPTGGGGGGGGGGSSEIELGNWGLADEYIDNIIQNYQHWAVGYMAWNLCLNTDGGPYLQMSQEAPIIVNTTTGEFFKQPFYYALGHFSKFIYPGSVRVGLTVDDSSVDLHKRSSGLSDSFATGGTNPTMSPTSSSFDGVATTNPDGSTTVILYNPSSDSVKVVLTDSNAGTISTTVEANSLNTFIYW